MDFAKWLEGLAARLPLSPASDETAAAEISPQAVEASQEVEASQTVEELQEAEVAQEVEGSQAVEELQEADVPQEMEGSRDFEEYLRTLPSLSRGQRTCRNRGGLTRLRRD